MAARKKVPQLLGRADLMRRWEITKQATIWRSQNHDDFPKPIQYIHGGKTAIYDLADVLAYEEKHGWNVTPKTTTEKGN